MKKKNDNPILMQVKKEVNPTGNNVQNCRGWYMSIKHKHTFTIKNEINKILCP